MLVEAKDVIFSPITESTGTYGRSIRISGLVFHSSLAVEKVTIDRDGDIALINVRLVPTSLGMSGNFTIDVNVENVSRVLFGPARAEIWPHTP